MGSKQQLPAILHFGPKTLESAAETITQHAAKQVLIFTDEPLRKLGKTEALENCIARTGAKIDIVDNVKPEPSVGDVEKTLAAVKNTEPDLIIGIGGGSVVDTA